MKHVIGFDYSETLKDRKSKRDLPLVGRIKLNFPIQEVQAEIQKILNENGHNKDIPFTMDPASSEHNYHLKNKNKESFIKNYESFYSKYSVMGFQSLSDNAKNIASKLEFTVDDLSPRDRLKGMTNTAFEKYHPFYDERNYTKPTIYLTKKIQSLFAKFNSEVCRAALVVLHPGDMISPHFDIGPEFITRLHFPVWTNPEARFGIKSGHDWSEYHFPSDGNAYFVNAGYEHYAYNFGNTSRYQIRICLNGQEDINALEELKPVQQIANEALDAHLS